MSNIIGQIKISSIEELHYFIQNKIIENLDFGVASKHYRGQANEKFILQTRLATAFVDPAIIQSKAQEIIRSFRNKLNAAGLLGEIYKPWWSDGEFSEDYYFIMQAQHIGIPTHFLDWSFDWRNALYFAIENENLIDNPGQLWVLIQPYRNDKFNESPYSLNKTTLINPSYDAHADLKDFLGEKRRSNQAGQFLVLDKDNCFEELEINTSLNASLILIIIQPELKHQIFELKKRKVDDILLETMRKMRIDFRNYNANCIYGTMNDNLKDVVNEVRNEFGFSLI